MVGDLKDELTAEMKRVGAYAVGIADPWQGFEYAPEGRHPLAIMPGCKSVVAFVVPRADIPIAQLTTWANSAEARTLRDITPAFGRTWKGMQIEATE